MDLIVSSGGQLLTGAATWRDCQLIGLLCNGTDSVLYHTVLAQKVRCLCK